MEVHVQQESINVVGARHQYAQVSPGSYQLNGLRPDHIPMCLSTMYIYTDSALYPPLHKYNLYCAMHFMA